MSRKRIRREAVWCVALATLALPAAARAAAGGAQAAVHSLVRLLGDGVGGVRFGTSQAVAIGELTTLFGSLKTVDLKPTSGCGLTAESTRPDVLFIFEKGKFVGYELGNASGKTSGQPDVATAAGLRLGDSVAQAERIYGHQFVMSAAQGGSWKVKTPRGEMVGLLVGPPVTGPTDRVDLIGAGYFGCPAMSP